MEFVSPRTSIYARHKSFSVEVLHYQDSCGDNKWFVYAYLFDNHPRHSLINKNEGMWQEAINDLPLHYGCSFARLDNYEHCGTSKQTTVWKIGADYSHLHDDYMQRQGIELINNPHHEPVIDAKQLYQFLEREYNAAQPEQEE